MDLKDDADQRLERLTGMIDEGILSKSRVVLVGPVDSFAVMSRALELGVADYVPRTSMSSKLPKVMNRVFKKVSARPG